MGKKKNGRKLKNKGEGMGIATALTLVEEELEEAIKKHESMQSYYEGCAVILEEFELLCKEIKSKDKSESRITDEAIRLAAMVMRFLVDCCSAEKGKP